VARLNLGELFVRLSADTKDFSTAMAGVGKTLDSSGKKMSEIGGKMSKAITLPLIGIATAAIATVAKFDDSMAKVSAITGATGDDLDDLRKQAKLMGAETRFSAVQAAEGMTFLGMAGFETHEIMEAMPAVLNLAAAGALDLARASDIASDIMSGFGIEASDMNRVADVLAKTASRANTSVELMGETMKFAAPIAKEFGVSLEESSAMAGLMADAGIKGSMAGTTLRTVFTRLAAPTDESAQLMKDLGIQTTDAEGNMKDMGSILRDTEGAFSGMSESQKLQAAETIFGKQAMTGMLAVVGRGADTFDEFVEQLMDSDGAAEDMANTMEDTLGGAFRQLRSATEGLLIEFGEVMVPVFRRVAEIVTEIARRFTTLDDRTKKIIVVAGVFLAALGPLLVIIGKLSIGLGALIGFVAGLSAPVLIVIAVIAGMVAGFIHLWQTNEEFRDRVLAVWEVVKQAFLGFRDTVDIVRENVMEFIDRLKSMAMPIIEQLGESFLKFIDGVMPAWESFKNALDGLMPLIKLVGGVVGAILGVMLAIFVGVINGIIQGLAPLIQALTGFVAFFTNIVVAIGKLLKGDFDGFWTHFKAAFKGAWDFIKGIVMAIIGVIRGFVEGFISVIKGLVRAVVGNSLIPNMFNSIMNWLKKLPTQAVGVIRNLVTAIVNGLKGLPSQMLAIGRNIVNSIWNGIKGMGATIKRNVANFIANSVPAPIRKLLGIGSPAKLFVGFGESVGEGLVKGVEGMKRSVERAGEGLVDRLVPDTNIDFGVEGDVRGVQRKEIVVELVGGPADLDSGTLKNILRGIMRDPEMMRDLDNIGFENFTTRVRPRGGV
jgi:TP901 family phage tail tape measure protein